MFVEGLKYGFNPSGTFASTGEVKAGADVAFVVGVGVGVGCNVEGVIPDALSVKMPPCSVGVGVGVIPGVGEGIAVGGNPDDAPNPAYPQGAEVGVGVGDCSAGASAEGGL